MNTYIALFRGINVGGHNSLPMKELVTILNKIGLKQVKTYLQSGNAIFQSTQKNTEDLIVAIQIAIQENYGFDVNVILLNKQQIQNAIDTNPYPEAEENPKSVHIYFLSEKSQRPNLQLLDQVKKDTEQYCLKEHLFYLYAPEGIGRSKLAVNVEKALAVNATARNWRSVNKILALASSL